MLSVFVDGNTRYMTVAKVTSGNYSQKYNSDFITKRCFIFLSDRK